MLKGVMFAAALSAASLWLVACESSSHDATAVVTKANIAWNSAFNQGDAKKLAGLYTVDATVSPGNGALLRSNQEIAALFESFFEMGLSKHAITPIEIYQQGDLATQVSEWSAVLTNQNGDTQNVGGILTSTLAPTGDGWKVRSHVWNAAP
ncbi:MAG: DUF4440 domain-containing protein [Pseudomonadota bacterium]